MNEETQNFCCVVLQSIPVAIVTTDAGFSITSFNRKAEEITGYDASEVIGKRCDMILRSSLCRSGCPFRMNHFQKERTGILAEIVTKDGLQLPVRVATSPLQAEAAFVPGYLMVLEDITREKELEREKENFQFMVVHDMKSPLVAMLGLAERLRRQHDEVGREQLEKYLQSICEAGAQLESQVTDFLEYSRQVSGKIELNLEEVYVPDVIDKLMERHLEQAKDKEIRLRVEHDVKEPILADPGQLLRAFENLLDNALKFSQPGDEIVLSTLESAEEIICRIQDSGPGIPSAELPYIFDAFHRSKSQKGSVGHGLGLAAVKAIMHKHGGEVSVKSEIGKGSLFTLFFPKRLCDEE